MGQLVNACHNHGTLPQTRPFSIHVRGGGHLNVKEIVSAGKRIASSKPIANCTKQWKAMAWHIHGYSMGNLGFLARRRRAHGPIRAMDRDDVGPTIEKSTKFKKLQPHQYPDLTVPQHPEQRNNQCHGRSPELVRHHRAIGRRSPQRRKPPVPVFRIPSSTPRRSGRGHLLATFCFAFGRWAEDLPSACF